MCCIMPTAIYPGQISQVHLTANSHEALSRTCRWCGGSSFCELIASGRVPIPQRDFGWAQKVYANKLHRHYAGRQFPAGKLQLSQQLPQHPCPDFRSHHRHKSTSLCAFTFSLLAIHWGKTRRRRKSGWRWLQLAGNTKLFPHSFPF